MDAVLRRLGALDLDGPSKRGVDMETNVVLTASSDGNSVAVGRLSCTGDEIEDDVGSTAISVLTFHFPEASVLPEGEFDARTVCTLLSSFTSIRCLVFLNVDARNGLFQQLLSTMLAHSFDFCTPKNVKLIDCADHENLLLNFAWEILSRGATLNLEILGCKLGPELREVVLGWTQSTGKWERFRIAHPQSEEECKALVLLAEEIFGDWRSSGEIGASWRMFEIESEFLGTFMEPNAVYEDHQHIRDASAQISISPYENLFSAFFHRSESCYFN